MYLSPRAAGALVQEHGVEVALVAAPELALEAAAALRIRRSGYLGLST